MTITRLLSLPSDLMSIAARGFVSMSESRLRLLGFGLGYLPVLTVLRDGLADTKRKLAWLEEEADAPGTDARPQGT